VLAERTGIGRLNTYRERQGKEGVKCVCGKPRERGYYLECKKFNSKSLVGLTPKGLRGPPGLWLAGEGAKDLIDWLVRIGYYSRWDKGLTLGYKVGVAKEEREARVTTIGVVTLPYYINRL
jgi:hypothetical protein